ncbi:MAG TPA: DNA polymerase III subunit alpha [Actinomycetota bacterium]|jgi:DNA polymerase-3 subunit alpha|nr:DNA polymerase III subunit alpha [Actinomycetota bacterium]
MTGKSFAHLHVHTEYSMLDGAARIRPLVQEAVRLGMPALAVTDHGALYGLIDFYETCNDEGIKPILGCELYLARGSMTSKLPGDDNPKTIQHITVLARNEQGYRNLLKLATEASQVGYYYKPRVDMELLARNSEGLIGTTGCLNGHVPRLILEGQTEQAREAAGRWREIFGPDGFFIELQNHGIEEQNVVNRQLIEFSKELAIPLVATNDLHYTNRSDSESHDVLLCIQTGATVDEPGRLRFNSDDFYLKSRAEMEEALGHYPEALDRTLEIAEMCDVKIAFGELQLPDFVPPDGSSLDAYLRRLAEEGARQRYGEPLPIEVRERLDYELEVISRMGFAGFFLIVGDLVNWAKGKGIRVGPGRGSAAGTITCYSLGITALDPLRYGLVFERFLNPERREMPDFDIDFDERHRGEVIRYLRQRYGEDRVAQIVTFATIKGKSAIRDSARVLGYPYGMGDRLAKMFPRPLLGKDPSLEDCFERSKDSKWGYAFTEAAELRKAYAEEPDARRVLEAARKLEGLRRQTGVHAAAVVIGPEPLVNQTALQRTDNDDVVTQYEMHAIEKLGLLKVDILGLGNLTVLELTVELLRARGVNVDIDAVPLDDSKVFELLQRGESDGVFQLESEGMRRLLKSLGPDRFEDIVALIALYRPGPMQEIDKYISNKHNPDKVVYPHPLLEDVLRDTYGVIVYQEQVLQLLQRIAGYTAGEADLVRKAVGKKVEKLMRAEEPRFLEGATAQGLSGEQARGLWTLIQPFAGYSFNRAHSACYGLIAYQTAYLKAHYPVEYLSALLTSVRDSKDEKTKYLASARKMGVEVLPPDVNLSQSEFAPDPERAECVRFGLAGVRNVGEGVVDHIIAARRDGPFNDFFDFCWRVDVNVLNKRTIESLVKAGAYDSMSHERGGLLEVFEQVVEQIASARRKESEGYVSLFDDGPSGNGQRTLVGSSLAIPSTELPKPIRLAYEKEMLGHYVTDHPLAGLEEVLGFQTDSSIASLPEVADGGIVTIAGIVHKVGKKFTRKGDLMFILEVEDLEASCEVIVFPAVAEKANELVAVDRVLCVRGRVDHREDVPKLVALELMEPDLSLMDHPVRIRVAAARCTAEMVRDLKSVLSEYPGTKPVFLHLVSGERETILRLGAEFTVDPANGCVDRLRALLGGEAVTV